MGKTGIIVAREFNERVRKRSFILTTILTPLLLVGLMVAPVLVSRLGSDKEKEILVVDRSGVVAPQLESGDRLTFRPETRPLGELRTQRQEVYGILVIGADVLTDPHDVQLYTYEAPTLEVENALSDRIARVIEAEKLKAYRIDSLPQILERVETDVSVQVFRIDGEGREQERSGVLSTVLAYLSGFLIYMFVFLYGAMVMQGVIEEKSSRVLEIMVSSVRPYELMMGKILGIAAVALTQFLIWVVLIFVLGGAAMSLAAGDALAEGAAAVTGGMSGAVGPLSGLDADSLDALRRVTDPAFLGRIFAGFVVYFIGGYLLYAAMFAAIGSAVDNVADSQQLQMPVTIPMVLALVVMLAVMNDPDGGLAFWFSMIPLTSPVIMMARLPYGVPFWEVALSVALLYASFAGMVWVAGKIYRVGIFMYGKKPGLKELFKWVRYKY